MDLSRSSPKVRRSSRKNLLPLFPDTLMAQRKKEWQELIKKLKISNENNPNDEIDLSNYIDGLETTTFQILKDIKTQLFIRNESMLLRDGNFQEMNRKLFMLFLLIRDHMLQEDVKAYIKAALKSNLTRIKKKVAKYKSNLGRNLILRKKQGKQPSKRIESLNEEIREEWQRLLQVMPRNDLVIYSLDVLKTHKLKKIETRQTREFLSTQSTEMEILLQQNVTPNQKQPKQRAVSLCHKETQHFRSTMIKKRQTIGSKKQ